ncbi:helix-turn-helix domain-containing protein [Lentibacter sp.]|uniref:helix-turn-helix domain-containing protein n=1 Tax=Lentibacter sp. TaxID=2024994 RepID=UPI003F6A352C
MTHQDKTPLTGTAALTKTPLEPEAVRRAAGLSAEDMAALLGMGDYGYSAWERGARTPGGPAQRLLALIATDPSKMIAALREA